MTKGKLSVFESAMLIAGSGLGTGILAIPYAASKTGFYSIVLFIIIAYAVTTVLHLLAADLVLHSKNSSQLIGIFREHLFCGKHGNILTIFFFVILAIVLFLNLTIYIIVASDVMITVLPLSDTIAKIFFYGISSLIVFLGIKIIGLSEKYSMILIFLVVLYLSVLSRWNILRDLNFTFGNPMMAIALYGMLMFSFSALFSVPQVVNNIENKSKIKFAIIAGIGTNAIITMIFKGVILAFGALWNQKDYKQYIVTRYSGYMKFFKSFSKITEIMGYIPIPKENEILNFPTLTMFFSKNNDTDYYNLFLYEIVKEIKVNYKMFIIGMSNSHPNDWIYKKVRCIKFKSNIYYANNNKDIILDYNKPVHIECGLL